MTGPVFEALTVYRGGVSGKFVNQENFTITNTNTEEARPWWYGPEEVCDVSYPAILNADIAVSGNTGAQTAGTAHTHPLTGTNALSGAAYYAMPQNNSWGSVIRASKTYVCNIIGFSCWTSATWTSGTIDVQLFRKKADRSLELAAFADIRTLVPSSPVRFDLSQASLHVSKGEEFVLRVANRASPSGTLNVCGISTVNVASPLTGWATTNSTQTNKNAYTQAEYDAAWALGTVTPWVYMAGDPALVPLEDKTYTDDFNRINLGPQWWNAGPVLGGSDYVEIFDKKIAYNGTVDGVQEITWMYPTAGNAVKMEAELYDPTVNVSSLVVHRRHDWSSGLALAVTDTTAFLAYQLGGAAFVTAASVSIENGTARWSLYFDEATETYVALKDGMDIGLSWNDSGGTVPRDDTTRFGGIGISRDSGINSAEIDNWSFGDWAP